MERRPAMALAQLESEETPPEQKATTFKETVEEESIRRQMPDKEVRRERFALMVANGTAPADAARGVDISVATAYRWLQDKSVKEAIAKVRGEVQAAGQRKLQRFQHGRLRADGVDLSPLAL